MSLEHTIKTDSPDARGDARGDVKGKEEIDQLELGQYELKRLSTTTLKELIEMDRQNNYNCCNRKLDRRVLEFLIQIIMMIYCIYQLVSNQERDNSFEVSVLSLILGIVSQNLRNGNNNNKGKPASP